MAPPRPNITIYKEHVWPTAAPRPRVLHDRAIELARNINQELASVHSHRILDRVIVNANQRISVSVRSKNDARYTLRTHWALTQAEGFGSAVQSAILHGAFPPNFDQIFDSLRGKITPAHLYQDSKYAAPNTEGIHVNLQETLERVAQYLPPETSHRGVQITWGKRAHAPSRRSIRLGSMDEKRALIRIHPVLDNAWVPPFVIEFVIWHELCHYVRPPLSRELAAATSDHRVHHRAFRALEARYPHMEAAETWIRRHIQDLLRFAATPATSSRTSR